MGQLLARNLRNKQAVNKIYCTFHFCTLMIFVTIKPRPHHTRFCWLFLSCSISENCPWNSDSNHLFCVDTCMKWNIPSRLEKSTVPTLSALVSLCPRPQESQNHFLENCWLQSTLLCCPPKSGSNLASLWISSKPTFKFKKLILKIVYMWGVGGWKSA